MSTDSRFPNKVQAAPAADNVRQLYPINSKPIKEFLAFIGDEDGLGGYTFRTFDAELAGGIDELLSKLAAENRNDRRIEVRAASKLIVKSTNRTLAGCQLIAQQIPLRPAWINQVSRGNDYDVIFNVEGLDDATKADMQQRLVDLFATVRDTAEFVQVPGFWNLQDRDNPFKVTCVFRDERAPTYTAAELEGALAKLKKSAFKEVAADTFNLKLPPLDTITADKPTNIETACKQWVYVNGIERYVNRLEPSQQWREKQFDARFNRFLGKPTGSISRELFKEGAVLRQYDSLCFTPGAGEIDGRNYNIWRPSPIKPVEGETEIWDEHIAELFPNEKERDILLNWMAWVLQNLGKKPHYALLLIGHHTGTGKSIVARIFEYLIGQENSKRPKSSSIGGDFNSWVKDCKLAVVEEILVLKNIQAMNALRDVITEPRVEVNTKFVPQFVIKTYLALMAISNSDKAIPLLKNDRRWLVLETFATAKPKEHYRRFSKLLPENDAPLTEQQTKALGAIYHQLLSRPLKDYDAYGRAPETVAREAMIEASANEWASHLLSVRDDWPLGSTRVVDPNTVIAMLPPRLHTAAARNKVCDFLREYMGGRPWEHPIRPNGRKGKSRRVWVLGSKIGALHKIDSKDVLRMFKQDDKGRADQVDAGSYVFRADDEVMKEEPPTGPAAAGATVDKDALSEESDE